MNTLDEQTVLPTVAVRTRGSVPDIRPHLHSHVTLLSLGIPPDSHYHYACCVSVEGGVFGTHLPAPHTQPHPFTSLGFITRASLHPQMRWGFCCCFLYTA